MAYYYGHQLALNMPPSRNYGGQLALNMAPRLEHMSPELMGTGSLDYGGELALNRRPDLNICPQGSWERPAVNILLV